MTTRRRSLARREPLVYRIEPIKDEGEVLIKAWRANAMLRIDGDLLATATVTDVGETYPRAQWITSKDTDQIHELPEAVRDGLFEFDDALRAHLKPAGS